MAWIQKAGQKIENNEIWIEKQKINMDRKIEIKREKEIIRQKLKERKRYKEMKIGERQKSFFLFIILIFKSVGVPQQRFFQIINLKNKVHQV